jgi:hypothetical protein
MPPGATSDASDWVLRSAESPGGLLAAAASRVVTGAGMLPLLALLGGVALVAVRGVTPVAAAASAPLEPSPLAGIETLRASWFLRQLALFVCLAALAESILDYQLAASGRRGRSPARGADELLRRLPDRGPRCWRSRCSRASRPARSRRSVSPGTAALKPAALVATSLAGALLPGLPAAVAARGCFAVLHNSLFRSAYELLYTPLPEAHKRPTKALVDVGADKLGAAAGGLVAAAVVALLPGWSARVLFGLTLLLGVGC